MKMVISISLIVVISILVIIWGNLSNIEIGKYDNFQEAIEKGIPYEIKKITHTEQFDGVTIVMYTTEPDLEEFPTARYDALAVAFFKGNDDEGWESIGLHGWTHYENDNMTVYIQPLREFDNKGNVFVA